MGKEYLGTYSLSGFNLLMLCGKLGEIAESLERFSLLKSSKISGANLRRMFAGISGLHRSLREFRGLHGSSKEFRGLRGNFLGFRVQIREELRKALRHQRSAAPENSTLLQEDSAFETIRA